ncbi:MAG: TlpA disulfide reductase family protein [Bdellovibrionota bacterium]
MAAHRHNRVWLLVLCGLLFVGLWVFLYKDALFSKPRTVAVSSTEKLFTAPLVLSSGQAMSFGDIVKERFQKNPNAKYLVVSFWATWCEPCVQEIPLLAKKSEGYLADGTEILLVNFDNAHLPEERKKVTDWVSSLAPKLTTVFDPKDLLIQSLDLSALPFNALIDRDMKWIWGDYGSLDFEKLEKKITSPKQN